ncbi:flagellar brake protein [Vibrio aestuarianus]|uniref:PilZ domain-containing protein n=2 Tax=Vibrio aestuarianus TaxID=28171 RepID=A0AAX3U988_9VIBR|nr:PilZ domain-containing protein [Vibrio aestuarianus]NGZ13526.1 flagellar brake protein [Vibrio aestuarianus]NKZ49674.1 flagellar brake protein [Vibrio aestuarianus]WGK83761.1 PilZ domain-containing protein [Vibrio aestuarianus]
MPIPNTNLIELLRLLKPGMKMMANIEFGPEDSYSFSTSVVGYKRDRYALLDMPTKVQEDLVMRKIVNVQVTLRGICDTEFGHILAFKSTIIRSMSKPIGLLFIRFPNHFVTKAIREHERYKLSLPATITDNERKIKAKLVDFSISGCALFITTTNDLEKETIINVKSALTPLLPSDLTSQIISIRSHENGYLVGVKFAQPIEMTPELKQEVLEHSFMAGLTSQVTI